MIYDRRISFFQGFSCEIENTKEVPSENQEKTSGQSQSSRERSHPTAGAAGLPIPAMLAQFVNVLYSIIDRMYIGNIANVGDIALAGVGICGPIVTMISAFAPPGSGTVERRYSPSNPANRIRRALPPSSPTALCF